MSYILELVNDYNLFETLEQKYSFSTVSNFKSLSDFIKCSKYPLKSSIDDFYITSIFFKTLTDYVRMFKGVSKII